MFLPCLIFIDGNRSRAHPSVRCLGATSDSLDLIN